MRVRRIKWERKHVQNVDIEKKQVKEVLRQLKNLGYNNQKISEVLSVAYVTVYCWEQGTRTPSWLHYDFLCSMLGVLKKENKKCK